jgi:hypothetical protein
MFVLVETETATSHTFENLVNLKEWMIQKDPTLFVTPELDETKVKETILENLGTIVTTLKNKIMGSENSISESNVQVEEVVEEEDEEKDEEVEEHMEGETDLQRYKNIYDPSKLMNRPKCIPTKYAILQDVDKWSSDIDTQFHPVCKDGFSAHEYSIRTFFTTLEPQISQKKLSENKKDLESINKLGYWFVKIFCMEKEWPEYVMNDEYTTTIFLPNAIKYCMYLFLCFPNLILKPFFSNDYLSTNKLQFPEGIDSITRLFQTYNRLDIFNEMISSITSPRLVIRHTEYFTGFFRLIHKFYINSPKEIRNYPWDELVTKLIIRNFTESAQNLYILNRLNTPVFPELKHDILQLFICMFLRKGEGELTFKSSELLTYLQECVGKIIKLDSEMKAVSIFIPGGPIFDEIRELMKSFIQPKALIKELKTAGIETVRKSAGVFYKGIEANSENKNSNFMGLIEKHLKQSEIMGFNTIDMFNISKNMEYTSFK